MNKGLPIILCLLILAAPTIGFANTDVSGKMNEAQLQKLRKDITELQQWLKKAQDEHKGLVSSLRKSDEGVAEISKQIESLRKSLKKERTKLKKLQAQQRKLDAQNRQQQTALNNVLFATYKLGQQPQLKLLLNQENPAKLARNFAYLNYINSAHQTKIENYRATLIKLNKVSIEVAEKKDLLKTNLADVNKNRRKLKKTRDNQKALAKKLNNRITGSDAKLQRLKEDRRRLIQLLGKVEEVFLPFERPKESRPFKRLKGKLPSPVKSSPKRFFGRLQDNGKQRWEGWVYKVNAGTDIRTVHHGRVVFSDWLRGYGLLTIIDHGQGYMTLYARNQALLRSVGDWVETGDIIARAGRSGGYSDDGLYFEVRAKGQPVNPRQWLAKRT